MVSRLCARLLPFWLPLFESGSGCAVHVQKVKERPLSLLCFFSVRKEVQLQGRSQIKERAEDADYCLLLLVEVQPPKEVEDA